MIEAQNQQASGCGQTDGRNCGHGAIHGGMTQSMCVEQACASKDRSPTIRTTVDVPAHHDFSAVLRALRDGQRATRAGWNAGGQHVEAQYPDKGSRMSVPYLVLKNSQGNFVPWVPSQGDLFATDWAVLPR